MALFSCQKGKTMQCLYKYRWVKLPRTCLPTGKGLMGAWARLASRAAFRKGIATYCGHENPVTPGMWSGGIVGLKSILGIKNRDSALSKLSLLREMGLVKFSLDPNTKSTLRLDRGILRCCVYSRCSLHDARLWLSLCAKKPHGEALTPKLYFRRL